jgi:hypothetical protein
LLLASITYGDVASAQPLPQQIVLASWKEQTIRLTDVKYDLVNGVAPTKFPASGTGTLEVVVFGVPLRSTAAGAGIAGPPSPSRFTDINADASGNMTGGAVVLGDPLGTGSPGELGFVIDKGAKLTAAWPSKQTPGVAFSGAITITVPFTYADGQPAALACANAALSMALNGPVSLHAPNASWKNAPASGFSVAGIQIIPGPADLDAQRPAGGGAWTFGLDLHSVDIAFHIPGIPSTDALTLKAREVKVNEKREVAFDATLSTTQPDGITLQLDDAPGFGLVLRRAQVKKNFESGGGKVWEQFSVDGALLLPPAFADESKQAALAFTAPNLVENPLLTLTLPKELDLSWNTVFGVVIPAGTSVALDLSDRSNPTAVQDRDVTWKGIFIAEARFKLPESFKTKAGDALLVRATNVAIGTDGFSGRLEVTGADIQLYGFPATLNGGTLAIRKDQFDASGSSLDAKLTIPKIAEGAHPANVALGFSANGKITATVDPGKNGELPTLSLGQYGSLGTVIESIGLDWDNSNRVGTISLDGQFHVHLTGAAADYVQDATLEFTRLGIQSNGEFLKPQGKSLLLKHPEPIQLGSWATLTVEDVGLGKDADRGLWFKLDGGVKLAEDLDVTAQVDFDGLVLSEKKQVEIGGLELALWYQDYVQILGHVDWKRDCRRYDPATNKIDENVQCFSGDVRVGVKLGENMVAGQGTFKTGAGSWFVNTDAEGFPPITLGNSGLEIYGFTGGMGRWIAYQCKPEARLGDSDCGAKEIYFDRRASPWTFVSSAKVDTVKDHTLMWGSAEVVLTPKPFSLELSGRVALMESPRDKPWDQVSRQSTTKLRWDQAARRFTAFIDVMMFYPDRSSATLWGNGTIEAVFSDNEQHVYLGWPIDKNAVPFNFGKYPNAAITGAGGLGFSIKPESWARMGLKSHGEAAGYPDFWFDLDGELDLEFCNGDAGALDAKRNRSSLVAGHVDVDLDQQRCWAKAGPEVGKDALWFIAGQVHTRGVVNFTLFSASAEGWLDAVYVPVAGKMGVDGRVRACVGQGTDPSDHCFDQGITKDLL